MDCLHSRVYCEENVIVDFFLAGHNVEKMEVFIYHPKEIIEQHFDKAHSLIGIVIVHHDEIIFEIFSGDIILQHYYSIGIECIRKIQHYPCAILG